ncbi:ngep-related [Anaeramoeba ignava]|uniref:Ngep-related n=1 Tax=Anaeramoeba ignava TaxID=1746090 RepID=A0A9Q0LY07_ANAIG|nr:ngep-related [Anaeramoeba ignava]
MLNPIDFIKKPKKPTFPKEIQTTDWETEFVTEIDTDTNRKLIQKEENEKKIVDETETESDKNDTNSEIILEEKDNQDQDEIIKRKDNQDKKKKHMFYEIAIVMKDPEIEDGKCGKKITPKEINKIQVEQAKILDKIRESGLEIEEQDVDKKPLHFYLVGVSLRMLEKWGEEMRTKVRLIQKDLKQIEHYSEFRIEDKSQYAVSQDFPDCVFPSAARQSLVTTIIQEKRGRGGCNINIPKSLHKNYMSGYFGLHNTKERTDLYASWTKRPSELFQFKQPENKIRDYFGEEISYYFAFLGFYSKWLIFPSVLGLVFTIAKYTNEKFKKSYGYVSLAYCLFNALWVTFFIEFWKRRIMTLAFRWDLLDLNTVDETPRPQFKGKTRKSPITGSIERYYPEWKRKIKYLFTYSIVLIMMAAAAACSIGINWKKLKGEKNLTMGYKIGTGVGTGASIFILDYFYRKIAFYLSSWENHKTEEAFQNAMIIKLFPFQFVNSFSSLFVIAFVSRLPDFLDTQLASLLLTRLAIGNFQELVVPFLKGKFRNCCSTFSRKSEKKMNPIVNQSNLPQYDNTIDDYSEMMLQLGYISLFSVSIPAVSFLAYLNNLIEIKVDSAKLRTMQRPLPRIRIGIGNWSYILNVISVLVVMINTALIAITYSDSLKDLSGFDTTNNRLWWLIGLEHAIFLIKYICHMIIPDTTTEVSDAIKQEQFKREKAALLYGKGIFEEDFNETESENEDFNETNDPEIKI